MEKVRRLVHDSVSERRTCKALSRAIYYDILHLGVRVLATCNQCRLGYMPPGYDEGSSDDGSSLMYELPKEPAKLRQRIRRYERAFKVELSEYGTICDGSGKRFLLAPLYLVSPGA